MYVRGCCRWASTANTPKQGAISLAQISNATMCRPERDNASKQTELTNASMSSSIYTARCVLKTNEEIEICLAKIYNHSQCSSSSWCDGQELAFISNIKKIQHYSFSTSFLCISYMHAAPWLFSWSMELCQPSGAGTISWKVSVVATTRVSRSLLTAFRILIRISKICFSIFFPDFLCWTYCGSDYSLA